MCLNVSRYNIYIYVCISKIDEFIRDEIQYMHRDIDSYTEIICSLVHYHLTFRSFNTGSNPRILDPFLRYFISDLLSS